MLGDTPVGGTLNGDPPEESGVSTQDSAAFPTQERSV